MLSPFPVSPPETCYLISICLCSRGWPCGASMRRVALGAVKVQCPSERECQGKQVREVVG